MSLHAPRLGRSTPPVYTTGLQPLLEAKPGSSRGLLSRAAPRRGRTRRSEFGCDSYLSQQRLHQADDPPAVRLDPGDAQALLPRPELDPCGPDLAGYGLRA